MAVVRDEFAKPSELVVSSWGGRWDLALRTAVSIPFQDRTGIPVRHLAHVGLDLPPTLASALEQKKRPPCDVVWCHSVAARRAIAWGEVLDEACVPRARELVTRAIPRGDAERRVVHPYILHYVLVYRTAAGDGSPPESWEALLDPRRRERLALYPGGNGLFGIAQLLGGGRLEDIPSNMDACWSFMRRLRLQRPAFQYSVGDMAQSFADGTLTLAMRALTNALHFKSRGVPVDWIAPREGVPDATDALWVPIGLEPHVAHWAKRYVDMALEPAVQTQWCDLLGTLPVHPQAEVPRLLTELRGAHGRIRTIQISDQVRVACEPRWANEFQRLFEGS
jgi:putative spermidine/putrescine transport system substrate-binding protein